MGRRQGKQGARGRTMVNADPVRSRAQRYAAGGHAVSQEIHQETKEVPHYLVGLKRKGMHTHLNAKRDLMRAHMALKVGVTGYGCIEGSYGTITYPATEMEKELLNAMSALAMEDAAAVVEGPAIGFEVMID